VVGQEGLTSLPGLYADPVGETVVLSKAGSENLVWIHERAGGYDRRSIQQHPLPNLASVAWTPEAHQVLILQNDGTVLGVDFLKKESKPIAQSTCQYGDYPNRWLFAANTKATRICLCEGEEEIAQYDQKTQLRFYSLDWSSENEFVKVERHEDWFRPIYPIAPRSDGRIEAVSFSPDGEYVAIGSGVSAPGMLAAPSGVEVWDLLLFGSQEARKQYGAYSPGSWRPVAKRLGPILSPPAGLTYSADGQRLAVWDSDQVTYIFKLRTGPAIPGGQTDRRPDEWVTRFDLDPRPGKGLDRILVSANKWFIAYDVDDYAIYDVASGQEIRIHEPGFPTLAQTDTGAILVLTRTSALMYENMNLVKSRAFVPADVISSGPVSNVAGVGRLGFPHARGAWMCRLTGKRIQVLDNETLEPVADGQLPSELDVNEIWVSRTEKGRRIVYLVEPRGISSWEVPQRFGPAVQRMRIVDDTVFWNGPIEAYRVSDDLVAALSWKPDARSTLKFYDLRNGKQVDGLIPPPSGWPKDTSGIDLLERFPGGDLGLVLHTLENDLYVGDWPAEGGHCNYWRKVGSGVAVRSYWTGAPDRGFLVVKPTDDSDQYHIVQVRDGAMVFSGKLPFAALPPPPLVQKNGKWTIDGEEGYNVIAKRVLFGGLYSYESITNVTSPARLSVTLDAIRGYQHPRLNSSKEAGILH
jgi:WD40 repeat protein